MAETVMQFIAQRLLAGAGSFEAPKERPFPIPLPFTV